MTIWRLRVACCISKATRAQTQAYALRNHTYTHAQTHAPADTHKYVILIAFPRQKRFHEAPARHVIRALPLLLIYLLL